MLTADQIDALRESARKIADPITAYLLRDIARRIAEAGELTSTAAYQIWRSQQLGVSQQELKKELQRLLGLSRQEMQRIFYQCAQSGYSLDVSRFPYVQALPFERNESLQQIVSTAVELAQEDFTNIVQTIGFVTPNGRPELLTKAYIDSCDFAFKQVVTGAASYTEAIRQATRNLAKKGIRVIDYESGIHTGLEAAVRRNMLGGLGLMQEKISQVTHDLLGCDGWEITAHANSAPDHEPIQGKQYSDAAYAALNGSLRRRIGTLNCGHAAFPIILGVNSPQYTPAELEKFRTDNEKGVTVDGVHYTGYQATQMQRSLERAIRQQKNRIMVDEAAGDREKLAQDKTKLAVLHQRYRAFSEAAGLRTQYERTEVAGFGEKRSLANSPERGILKDINGNGIQITAAAIQRVPQVCPEGWSQEQAERLQEAHRELLRYVKDEPVGKEAGFLLGTDGDIIYRIMGGYGQVQFPQLDEEHIIAHNHPDGRIFSYNDIKSFVARGWTTAMSAVGNDGKLFMLVKRDEYDGFRAYCQINSWKEILDGYISRNDVNGYVNGIKELIKEMGQYGVEFIKS